MMTKTRFSRPYKMHLLLYALPIASAKVTLHEFNLMSLKVSASPSPDVSQPSLMYGN